MSYSSQCVFQVCPLLEVLWHMLTDDCPGDFILHTIPDTVHWSMTILSIMTNYKSFRAEMEMELQPGSGHLPGPVPYCHQTMPGNLEITTLNGSNLIQYCHNLAILLVCMLLSLAQHKTLLPQLRQAALCI